MVIHPPLARRAWAGMLLALVGALLLAQMQGQMHRVVHIEHQHTIQARGHVGPVHADAAADAKADEESQAHWVLRLFASHYDDATCRLFDQSGQSASLPSVPLLVLPVLASLRHAACFEAARPAEAVALTLARGPPFPR